MTKSIRNYFRRAITVATWKGGVSPVKGLTGTSVVVHTTTASPGLGVRYHTTMVAWKDDETSLVTLDSGGFYTATTTRRMNQALIHVFGTRTWSVRRQRGSFILSREGMDDVRFTDKVTV